MSKPPPISGNFHKSSVGSRIDWKTLCMGHPAPSNPFHKASRFLIKAWLVVLILVGIQSLFSRVPGGGLIFFLTAGLLLLVLWLDQIPSAWGGWLLLLAGVCMLIWMVITSFDSSGARSPWAALLGRGIFFLPPLLLGAGLLIGQSCKAA